ncbi:MAG: DNA alkylation repair protein [Bernardetiaceae bacterium]|jgi:3-methyladenine DNA glycosylase AlkD|nr:DNA alkylation repair protein [Bernardetiaceae bacterium]
MTTAEIMAQLAQMGSASVKKVLLAHGAREPFFGVKVGDMKQIQKVVKKNHALALELYATGNSDAMYLAGLIADEAQITPDQLQTWAQQAYWPLLSESTVAWVAAESPHGYHLAQQWIEAPEEHVAAAGWATLASWLSLRPDPTLDLPALAQLLQRVVAQIHQAPNRVRYAMNGFVIALGSYVPALHPQALAAAQQVGPVTVEMNGTACQVPYAPDYIGKVVAKGNLGKKKKTARC